MHITRSHTSPLSSLFPSLASFNAEDAIAELQGLCRYGSSGERCLAEAAICLWERKGLLADLLRDLDQPSFERFITTLVALRERR